MTELISETRPIARKNHDCMASDWLQDVDLTNMLTFAERRALVIARREKWEIKPGSRYIHQTCKYEGDIFTFKARPEMHEICLKHELYQD